MANAVSRMAERLREATAEDNPLHAVGTASPTEAQTAAVVAYSHAVADMIDAFNAEGGAPVNMAATLLNAYGDALRIALFSDELGISLDDMHDLVSAAEAIDGEGVA